MNESSIAHHTLNLFNGGMLLNILQNMFSSTIILLLVTTEYGLDNALVKFAIQRFLSKHKGDTRNNDQYPTWYYRDTNEYVYGVI